MRASRVRLLVTTLVIATVASVCVAFEEHVLVQNLRVVEAGQIFRGAEQKPWPLGRLIRRHSIRTVLCLVEPEPNERAVTESLGAIWMVAPLTSESATTTFDELERAASIIAEPNNRPIMFHCKRGVYRSNLVQGVFRLQRCGWSLDETIAELRQCGFDPEASGGDASCAELLARYVRERQGPDVKP